MGELKHTHLLSEKKLMYLLYLLAQEWFHTPHLNDNWLWLADLVMWQAKPLFD